MISHAVPGYGEWLKGMRQMRNAIKTGVGVAIQTETNFLTGVSKVKLQMKLLPGDDPVLLALSDVSNALSMSVKLTEAIISTGQSNGLLASRFG